MTFPRGIVADAIATSGVEQYEWIAKVALDALADPRIIDHARRAVRARYLGPDVERLSDRSLTAILHAAFVSLNAAQPEETP